MSVDNDEENKLLSHHEQLPLCTTRLPYRQGRKLTAVKVYTINSESNHLLIFGVPSINLQQETKSLFIKFGKLLQFSITTEHPTEAFTETYHAKYERIQSARVAKRMLDTKNFYGGSLHVCYAPELESIDETRNKLWLRKRDISFRLKNLKNEVMDTSKSSNRKEIEFNTGNDMQSTSIRDVIGPKTQDVPIVNELPGTSNEHLYSDVKKINMGVNNIIYLNKNKRKFSKDVVIEKRFKPCFVDQSKDLDLKESNIEIVDFTSTEKETVSNINEALNYNKFGNEIIRKVQEKPLNRIIFKTNKNS